jgi:hypothetical protein
MSTGSVSDSISLVLLAEYAWNTIKAALGRVFHSRMPIANTALGLRTSSLAAFAGMALTIGPTALHSSFLKFPYCSLVYIFR